MEATTIVELGEEEAIATSHRDIGPAVFYLG
jgi:hypothetical protein